MSWIFTVQRWYQKSDKENFLFVREKLLDLICNRIEMAVFCVYIYCMCVFPQWAAWSVCTYWTLWIKQSNTLITCVLRAPAARAEPKTDTTSVHTLNPITEPVDAKLLHWARNWHTHSRLLIYIFSVWKLMRSRNLKDTSEGYYAVHIGQSLNPQTQHMHEMTFYSAINRLCTCHIGGTHLT